MQTRPVEGFAVRETAPAKPFKETTVMVEVPELVARLVARIVAGATAPVATEKPAAGPTETETVVDLDKVPGVVPVTGTVKV